MAVSVEDFPPCTFCDEEYGTMACFQCPDYDGPLDELTKKLELGRSDPHE